MLSPLTPKTIALLHRIAQGEPYPATDLGMSAEELHRICARLEQKELIRPAANADIFYTLCRPLRDISLLDVLQATDGHLDCNTPATEEFYSRYGKVAQKLGVINYMTRRYLSEIRLTDFY